MIQSGESIFAFLRNEAIKLFVISERLYRITLRRLKPDKHRAQLRARAESELEFSPRSSKGRGHRPAAPLPDHHARSRDLAGSRSAVRHAGPDPGIRTRAATARLGRRVAIRHRSKIRMCGIVLSRRMLQIEFRCGANSCS
jgi:hypothetical protein